MKKLFFAFVVLCCMVFCLTFSACDKQDSSESSETSSIAGPVTDDNISVPDSTEMDKNPASEENEQDPEETMEKDDPPRENAGTTVPFQTEREGEKTDVSSEPDKPQEPMAGEGDDKAVAEKVLKYTNGFRNSPAVSLTGLTDYARYRSRQIVSNFSHDTNDQRAAATALQYGEYVDPSVYGGHGEPYYRANAREAIAKAGYSGTVDEVALKLATLVKNSPNHWKYIGSPEYTYIAVGVTYESGMWYCVITVTAENTDEY